MGLMALTEGRLPFLHMLCKRTELIPPKKPSRKKGKHSVGLFSFISLCSCSAKRVIIPYQRLKICSRKFSVLLKSAPKTCICLLEEYLVIVSVHCDIDLVELTGYKNVFTMSPCFKMSDFYFSPRS